MLKKIKIQIEQWRYEPTAGYGGPKVEQEKMNVKKIAVSNNRKILHLQIDGLKEKHVVYFRLPHIKSKRNQELWTTESWYTLNTLPKY